MTEVAKITRVQVNPNGNNEILVDVRSSPNRAWSEIRYRSPMKDIWYVPENGDIVEVVKAGGSRIALGARHFPDQSLPQNLTEGDIAIKLNDNVRLRFSKQSDGTYNFDVDVDGDLQLTANNILVGKDGNRTKVATENHTHDYEDELSDGSTTTKTTGGPSDTTSTEVE